MDKVDRILIGPFDEIIQRVEELEMHVFGKNAKGNKLDGLTEKVKEFEV